MFHGGGISPYGVDMFPGGVPGGAALPSPSAYSNPAATQFGVSLRKLIRKFPQIFSQIKKSNLACNKVCLGSIFKNIFPKFLKGENRAKKPTGSENFLSDFEPRFFRRCTGILESLEICQLTKLDISGPLFLVLPPDKKNILINQTSKFS